MLKTGRRNSAELKAKNLLRREWKITDVKQHTVQEKKKLKIKVL